MNQKERNIVSLIKGRIIHKDPTAEVILFGSHARGQAGVNSDWDILILVNIPKMNRNIEREYRDELFDVELDIGAPISALVFSKLEWETKHYITPLYQNIKNDGVLI